MGGGDACGGGGCVWGTRDQCRAIHVHRAALAIQCHSLHIVTLWTKRCVLMSPLQWEGNILHEMKLGDVKCKLQVDSIPTQSSSFILFLLAHDNMTQHPGARVTYRRLHS